MTDLIGAHGANEILRMSKTPRPFLLSLHFTAPHWPWEGPDDEHVSRDLTDLFHYDGGNLETYGRIVVALDAAVGQVLAALDAQGVADDTIVVFTSDNGGERFSKNWPFTGQKTELLEGGLRVPTLLRWPACIRPQVQQQVTITMDWLPTLLAAAASRPMQRIQATARTSCRCCSAQSPCIRVRSTGATRRRRSGQCATATGSTSRSTTTSSCSTWRSTSASAPTCAIGSRRCSSG
jgi:hypothetical protein